MKVFKVSLILGCLFSLVGVVIADASKVVYPEGYRGWFHVKSMVLFDGHALANPFAGPLGQSNNH